MIRRRNRTPSPGPSEVPQTPQAVPISLQELATLVSVFDHAYDQISRLGDVGEETAGKASGTVVIPALYARAGLAATLGRGDIPLLADEVGLLEAAVLNLESYEGNEVALCSGYQLLEFLTERARNSRPVRQVHGIFSFHDEDWPPLGTPAPVLPGGEGPERVS